MKIREMLVDEIFYPGDRERLHAALDLLLGQAETGNGKARLIMAPHAGFSYIGKTIAAAYKAAASRKIKRVIIMGAVHRDPGKGVFLPDAEAFNTPLGLVRVDTEAVDLLVDGRKKIFKNQIPHDEEHCLEVHLPFIRTLFPDAVIVPVLTGIVSKNLISLLTEKLKKIYDEFPEETLLVVSTNLSEYDKKKNAENQASRFLEQLAAEEWNSFPMELQRKNITACGAAAVPVLMPLLKTPCSIKIICSNTPSCGPFSEASQDEEKCVSYGAIAVF